MPPLSARTRARLLLVASASLWSSSGAFSKLLALPGPTLAFYRTLFAGLCLLPLVGGRRLRFRWPMVGMVLCFAIMNVTFMSSMKLTSAANAIFLQYTAPLWMFLASVLLLGERTDRRSLAAVAVGMVGIVVIVAGGSRGEALGIALGLVAGVGYAGVAVFLRFLRDEDPIWLTVVNHLGASLLLFPALLTPMLAATFVTPTWGELGALAVFGAVQMALPYVLFSRALHSVSTQEAGILLLLEPVLNTMLAYLVAGERPADATLVGGAILLAAVAVRYARR